METNEKHKKHRIRRPIAAKHKEPIAAASAGVLLVALLIVFGLGVFMIRDYINYDEDPDNQVSQSQTNAPATKTPPLTASISSVSYSDGDPAFQPMPGQHYAIVDVDVVHNLDAPTWLSPLLQSFIMDAAGKKYELSPITLEQPFDAREYKIGEHATGELSYMIPENVNGLNWCYEIKTLKVCKPL